MRFGLVVLAICLIPLSTTADPSRSGFPMMAMDGNMVVTRAERDPQTVQVLNVDGSVRCLITTSEGISCLAVRKGRVALGSYFGTLEVHDADRGGLQRSKHVGDNMITAIDIAPDGTEVTFGDNKGYVGQWKPGGQVASLAGHKGLVQTLSYSPNGKLLASGSGDGSVNVWEGGSLKAQVPCPDSVQCLAFGPDNASLAIGGDFRDLLVWSLTGTLTRVSMPSDQTLSVVFSPDGKRIAAGNWGTIRIVRIDPPGIEKTFSSRELQAGVIAIHFERDFLRSGDFDGNIKTWRMR